MDIDGVFLPIGEELIDQVFPTPIVYHQDVDTTRDYDPLSGSFTRVENDVPISAGVISRRRV